jgi:hypothetical protein
MTETFQVSFSGLTWSVFHCYASLKKNNCILKIILLFQVPLGCLGFCQDEIEVQAEKIRTMKGKISYLYNTCTAM